MKRLLLLLLIVANTAQASEVLCKNDGKIYDVLSSEGQNTCFKPLYWGGVCFQGSPANVASQLSKRLPLQSNKQLISSVTHNLDSISYRASDLRHNVSETMTIFKCSQAFLR